MMTLPDLLASHCQPLEGSAAMTEDAIRTQLSVLPHWSLTDGALVRTYRLPDYHATIEFVNALAWVVHAQDHHPDLLVGYNRCEVRFSTHSVGGISLNDFICAARIDAVWSQRSAD